MKILYIVLLVLAVQKDCSPGSSFQFITATSQNWMGGPAGTRGTYYKVYFQMADTTGIRFDSLWVNGRRIPFSSIGGAPADTVMLLANDYSGITNPMNQRPVENAVDAPFPAQSTAAGLVGYFMKGERAFIEIPSWTVLKPLYHQ